MLPKFNFKLIIGGMGGVGKTTLIYRYINNTFLTNTEMTIGIQFHIKKIEVNGIVIALTLWDLGGQERFRFVQPQYCRGALGGFVVFDMTEIETLDSVDEWISMFKKNAGSDLPIVLIGTKNDLINDDNYRNTVINLANQKTKKHGYIAFFPTSSKSGENIGNAIEYMIKLLITK